MKKGIRCAMSFFLILALTACSGQQTLVDIEMTEIGGRSAVVWEGRTYYPFCVVSKNDRGEQIGYINGDHDNRISEYKDYSPKEWIVSWLTVDGGAMLYKEESVMEIPDGLESEYD